MRSQATTKMQKVYSLLRAKQATELYDTYLKEDQKIVKDPKINYFDPKHITNKVKKILEELDARTLSSAEKKERRLILWLWYHHAISYAIWGEKDRQQARSFSAQALRHQPKDHSNHITCLLYLLVRDRLREA